MIAESKPRTRRPAVASERRILIIWTNKNFKMWNMPRLEETSTLKISNFANFCVHAVSIIWRSPVYFAKTKDFHSKCENNATQRETPI